MKRVVGGEGHTLSSVTFQSLIFIFGGSFDHETYMPFTIHTTYISTLLKGKNKIRHAKKKNTYHYGTTALAHSTYTA